MDDASADDSDAPDSQDLYTPTALPNPVSEKLELDQPSDEEQELIDGVVHTDLNPADAQTTTAGDTAGTSDAAIQSDTQSVADGEQVTTDDHKVDGSNRPPPQRLTTGDFIRDPDDGSHDDEDTEMVNADGDTNDGSDSNDNSDIEMVNDAAQTNAKATSTARSNRKGSNAPDRVANDHTFEDGEIEHKGDTDDDLDLLGLTDTPQQPAHSATNSSSNHGQDATQAPDQTASTQDGELLQSTVTPSANSAVAAVASDIQRHNDERWASIPEWQTVLPTRSAYLLDDRKKRFLAGSYPWPYFFWLFTIVRDGEHQGIKVLAKRSVERALLNILIGMILSAINGVDTPEHLTYGDTAFIHTVLSSLCEFHGPNSTRLPKRLLTISPPLYEQERRAAGHKYKTARLDLLDVQLLVAQSKAKKSRSHKLRLEQMMVALRYMALTAPYNIPPSHRNSQYTVLPPDTTSPSTSASASAPSDASSTGSKRRLTTTVASRSKRHKTSDRHESNAALTLQINDQSSLPDGQLPASGDTQEFQSLHDAHESPNDDDEDEDESKSILLSRQQPDTAPPTDVDNASTPIRTNSRAQSVPTHSHAKTSRQQTKRKKKNVSFPANPASSGQAPSKRPNPNKRTGSNTASSSSRSSQQRATSSSTSSSNRARNAPTSPPRTAASATSRSNRVGTDHDENSDAAFSLPIHAKPIAPPWRGTPVRKARLTRVWSVAAFFNSDGIADKLMELRDGAHMRLPPGVNPMAPIRLLHLVIMFSLNFMQLHINHMASHKSSETCRVQQDNGQTAHLTLLWLLSFGLLPETEFARDIILALLMGLQPRSVSPTRSHELCARILDEVDGRRRRHGLLCPAGCILGFPDMIPFGIRFNPADLNEWLAPHCRFHNERCRWIRDNGAWIDQHASDDHDPELLAIHAQQYDTDVIPVPQSVTASSSTSAKRTSNHRVDPATGVIIVPGRRLHRSRPSSSSGHNQPFDEPQDSRGHSANRASNPQNVSDQRQHAADAQRSNHRATDSSRRSNANRDTSHDNRRARSGSNPNNNASSGSNGRGGSGGGDRRNNGNNGGGGNRRSNRDDDVKRDDDDIEDDQADDSGNQHRLAFPAPGTENRPQTAFASRTAGLPHAGDFEFNADPSHPNYEAINRIPDLSCSEAIQHCLMRDFDGRELTVSACCADQTKGSDTTRNNSILAYINLANMPSAQNLEGTAPICTYMFLAPIPIPSFFLSLCVGGLPFCSSALSAHEFRSANHSGLHTRSTDFRCTERVFDHLRCTG